MKRLDEINRADTFFAGVAIGLIAGVGLSVMIITGAGL